jgi:3'(2'), 5'-bisphosphate nucleotidase
MPSTETDGQLATRLATQAGHLLLELREKMFAEGALTWDVKDAGDAVAQRFLAGSGSDRVWIAEPLYGNREFSEPGRIDWAVHNALWTRDSFGAAAVSLPAIGHTFTTDDPTPVPPAERERPILVTSRTRAPYAPVLVADGLDCDAVRLGSPERRRCRS